MTPIGDLLERLEDSLKEYVKETRVGDYFLKMRDARWQDKKTSLKETRKLWNRLSRKSRLGFISHLQRGETWDEKEFQLVGVRFVDRIMERINDYGEVEPSYSNILEIGCGVGRFLKPLACRFKDVVGVDIAREMLAAARNHLSSFPNVTVSLNDGTSLKRFEDNSFDYCFSAGVFQHITHIEVILDYVKEALRVLKPGGVFLFQFVGSRIEEVGHDQFGAKITASGLDRGLSSVDYLIREVSLDPADPIRNVVIVIQKPKMGEKIPDGKRSFSKFPKSERRWLSGVYDDITTRTQMHERLKKGPDRLTFYDE